MSFLAPLFLLGALAIALPVIFHLIRRATREKVPFSSLMFLQPSPPRLTRRSRLEHILLLLLRCLVFCLLALGFARPFLQRAVSSDPTAESRKKIVVLVDTSASMRRDDLWAAARAKAEQVLTKTAPADQVAVFTFDRQVNRLVNFEQWSAANAGERAAQAARRLGEITPAWSSTYLGSALVSAAEALEANDGSLQQAFARRQIVLISDVQEGSRLDTLQSYEWPKKTELVIEPVKAKRPTNAGLQLVTDPHDSEKTNADIQIRVRVSNSAVSKKEQFQVGWTSPDAQGFVGSPVDVYVPPGQSRVVTAPPAPSGTALNHLALRGDDDDFDNVVHVVPPETARVTVLYLGKESEKDTTQPLYFLQRAFQQTRRQVVQIIARGPETTLLPADTDDAQLIIASDELPDAQSKTLRRLLADGKTAVVVLKNAAAAPTLGRLLDIDPPPVEEAPGSGYAMLGEIDFQHPLFAPFADPRFSDFTKIHFWKHRRLDAARLPGARVLARFDDSNPALLQMPVGKGTLLILTSGWHPADSQLALSSKFVPLLYSMLEQGGGLNSRPTQYFVGDTVPLFPGGANTNLVVTVRKPDGSVAEPAKGKATYSQTDQPGIYTVSTPDASYRFAVNLDPAESKTAPLPLEELERLGVPLKNPPALPAAQVEQSRRQLLANELENRQKLWRWLIVAALVVLLMETWLAGRITRRLSPA